MRLDGGGFQRPRGGGNLRVSCRTLCRIFRNSLVLGSGFVFSMFPASFLENPFPALFFSMFPGSFILLPDGQKGTTDSGVFKRGGKHQNSFGLCTSRHAAGCRERRGHLIWNRRATESFLVGHGKEATLNKMIAY